MTDSSSFTYDMAKLKILDRDPVAYRRERSRVTNEVEQIRPMFSNGGFNNQTFNKVFEHFKKPDTATSSPVAMLSTKMPAYGYALDGGQTMLKSDREYISNGASQLAQAYNSHTNPDEYTDSLLQKCKSKQRVSKEKALMQSEIQARLNKYRGAVTDAPKRGKPDFTAPVDTTNSMIQEEEAPAEPVILDDNIQLPQRAQFQVQQPQVQPQPHFQPFQQFQQPQVQQFQQPQVQQFQQPQVQQFQQPQVQPFQQFQQPQVQPFQQFQQPQVQQFQQPPQFQQQSQVQQQQYLQQLPGQQMRPVQQAQLPKQRRPQPPIYNRSALQKPPSVTSTHNSGSEISELKKLIKKQEEQIALLMKERHY